VEDVREVVKGLCLTSKLFLHCWHWLTSMDSVAVWEGRRLLACALLRRLTLSLLTKLVKCAKITALSCPANDNTEPLLPTNPSLTTFRPPNVRHPLVNARSFITARICGHASPSCIFPTALSNAAACAGFVRPCKGAPANRALR
jgi:hypothetical protein